MADGEHPEVGGEPVSATPSELEGNDDATRVDFGAVAPLSGLEAFASDQLGPEGAVGAEESVAQYQELAGADAGVGAGPDSVGAAWATGETRETPEGGASEAEYGSQGASTFQGPGVEAGGFAADSDPTAVFDTTGIAAQGAAPPPPPPPSAPQASYQEGAAGPIAGAQPEPAAFGTTDQPGWTTDQQHVPQGFDPAGQPGSSVPAGAPGWATPSAPLPGPDWSAPPEGPPTVVDGPVVGANEAPSAFGSGSAFGGGSAFESGAAQGPPGVPGASVDTPQAGYGAPPPPPTAQGGYGGQQGYGSQPSYTGQPSYAGQQPPVPQPNYSQSPPTQQFSSVPPPPVAPNQYYTPGQAPAVAPQQPAKKRGSGFAPLGGLLMLIGAGAAALGSYLDWFEVRVGGDVIVLNGMENAQGDPYGGWGTLIAAGIVAFFALIYLIGGITKRVPWAIKLMAFLTSVFIIAWSAYYIVTVPNEAGVTEHVLSEGIVACLVGGIIAAFGSLFGRMKKRPKT